MSFPRLLNQNVDVSRPTRVSDGAGGSTETYSNAYTNARARIMPISGKEQSLYSSEKVIPTHKVFMKGNLVIREDDRLIFGSRTFDIELVRKIDEAFHLEIDVREITALDGN